MTAPLPDSIPAVIARLREIEGSAPSSDGVACFARLYREVTEGVGAELAQPRHAVASFLERLDVGFAGLFFSALDAYEQGASTVPSAWVPLFGAGGGLSYDFGERFSVSAEAEIFATAPSVLVEVDNNTVVARTGAPSILVTTDLSLTLP